MIETVKSIFKYYIAYFIFTSILSFIIAYFFIAPYMGNDKALGLNNENTYILLKSENIKIKDESVNEYINERLSYYNKYLENEKIRVDRLLENKRILLKNGIAFEQHKDIDCSINFFIEKALILGKTDLVKEYTNLRKKEMPECIY